MPPRNGSKPTSKKGAGSTPIWRFAHPFFTTTPPAARAAIPNHGRQMLDHIQGNLHPIPPIKRNNGQWSLDEIIGKDGAAAIEATGKITIHLAGDTGVPETDHETQQVLVAEAMAKDYDPHAPEKSPAFFFHLGDVIYGQTQGAYLDQFYRPYMHYPGKIIAIPGNHDGDFDSKMADFQKYFCANSQTVPSIANTILRQTMTQPGVFWCLDAPFVQIIGLYSNAAENPGFISGPQIGQKQKDWLVATLKGIKKSRDGGTRKALFMATHHPPFSSGGHSGSDAMLKDIDDACKQANIMPDAYFSGHAHSIQRYTRTVSFGGQTLKIPYIVSGCGGHGGQAVDKGVGAVQGDHKYELGYEGWGYTRADITHDSLLITSYGLEAGVVKNIDTYQAPLVV